MVRPKDAKVWNEDLINALEARHQKGMREGKRDAHTWKIGREKIQAVRKDIYQFRTGTIVNMPTNLTKRVNRLCEEIIRGVKNVYPDGHVPTNGEDLSNMSGGAAGGYHSSGGISASSPVSYSTTTADNNPFNNDHYMKTLKVRGGSFAILMAFHHSQSSVLRKSQICVEAQRFCDDQMDANFHAGRTYGAWASIKTLTSRNLVSDSGFRGGFVPGRGMRDRPHDYSLTKDGELFIKALLAKRPAAAAAAGQVVGLESRPLLDGSPAFRANNVASPFGNNRFGHTAASHTHMPPSSSSTTRISDSKSKNIYSDRTELEEWIATAEVGDRKNFKAGKDRRKKLHDLCDALQRKEQGLILTHSSSGTARGRVLTIQIVSRLSSRQAAMGKKRPPPSSNISLSDEIHGYGQSTGEGLSSTPIMKSSARTLTPRENAARAAMNRQEQAKESALSKSAIAGSKKIASRPPRPHRQKIIDVEDSSGEDDDDNLQKAIKESLKDSSKKPPAVKKADNSLSSSKKIAMRDKEFQRAIKESLKESKKSEESLKESKKSEDDVIYVDSASESSDHELSRTLFSASRGQKRKNINNDDVNRRKGKKKKLLKVAPSIDLSKSDDDDDDDEDEVIEIMESQEEIIDRADDDDVIIVDNNVADSSSNGNPKNDTLLTIMIDNRERNRNATPRTLRMELTRHLASGPLRAVWPDTLPLAQVEEVGLQWGDIQYSVSDNSRESRRLGVSIERKRVNDLVQRSFDGDHLTQLFRMQQKCSLSILLIENDLKTASSVTPYNAQNREGFDPLDSTITCEDDIFRMFGRVVLSSDAIKFIQTRDEQSSLRAIGALGLMAASAPTKYTNEVIQQPHELDGRRNSPDDFQALCDELKQGGIPWRLAKRIASATGSLRQLKALYSLCCDEQARSKLLSHVIESGNVEYQDNLRSSSSGWSEAIYRIVSCSNSANTINGEAALLLHKNVLKDHGLYLSILYQGYSHEEALSRISTKPASLPTPSEVATRHVSIHLTGDQAKNYFPQGADNDSFYKLSIVSGSGSHASSSPITMCTVCESLSSKPLSIFEIEGSKIIDLIRGTWNTHKKDDYVAFTKDLASRVDTKCRVLGRSSTKRIILVCGLQPALDADAKKSGYLAETKTVVDLLFAELLLCYDITVIQALRKKMENRVDAVKQLALACFHYGFLLENKGNG
ncbi:MAG: ERCC4-type nuclease [Bacillariaceae sp.]|jgi:ERCC4-type nuclease